MGNKSSTPPVVLTKEDMKKNCGDDLKSPKCKAYRVNIIYSLILGSIGILLFLLYLANYFRIDVFIKKKLNSAVNTVPNGVSPP